MLESTSSRRWLAVAAQLVTVALLIPGLLAPVITVRGRLDPVGVRALAPRVLEEGLSDSVVAAVRLLVNPALLPMLEVSPGGLKGALLNVLNVGLGAQLGSEVEIEVYRQRRSIGS